MSIFCIYEVMHDYSNCSDSTMKHQNLNHAHCSVSNTVPYPYPVSSESERERKGKGAYLVLVFILGSNERLKQNKRILNGFDPVSFNGDIQPGSIDQAFTARTQFTDELMVIPYRTLGPNGHYPNGTSKFTPSPRAVTARVSRL